MRRLAAVGVLAVGATMVVVAFLRAWGSDRRFAVGDVADVVDEYLWAMGLGLAGAVVLVVAKLWVRRAQVSSGVLGGGLVAVRAALLPSPDGPVVASVTAQPAGRVPGVPGLLAGEAAWERVVEGVDVDGVEALYRGARGAVLVAGGVVQGLSGEDGSTVWSYSRSREPGGSAVSPVTYDGEDYGRSWEYSSDTEGEVRRSGVGEHERLAVVLDTMTGRVVAERTLPETTPVVQLTNSSALLGLEAVSIDDGSTWPLGEEDYLKAVPEASVSRLVLCSVTDVDSDQHASVVASLDVATGEVTRMAQPVPVKDDDRPYRAYRELRGWPTADTSLLGASSSSQGSSESLGLELGRMDGTSSITVPLRADVRGVFSAGRESNDLTDAAVAAPGGVVVAHAVESSRTSSVKSVGTYLVGLR